MREIKFKVWDKKSKKMRSLDSIAFDADNNIKLVNGWGCDIIEDKMIIVRREKQYELLQYTGLKDTNDIAIYEADIISTHKHDFIVRWDEIGGMYLFHETNNPDSGMDYYEFEENYSYYGFHVIGNVYENPDLLEGE